MDEFVWKSSWGSGSIRFDGDNLVAVRLPGMPVDERRAGHGAAARARTRPIEESPAIAQELAESLSAYVAGETTWPIANIEQVGRWLDHMELPPFQRRVLGELAQVPYGSTVTYGELAGLAGEPGAARAAGTACSANPFLLVIPCHRVLPAAGGIGSFGSIGSAVKQRLLDLEQVAVPA